MEKSPWWKGERGEWYVVVQFILFGLVIIVPFLFDRAPWPQPWRNIAIFIGAGLGLGGVEMLANGMARLGNNLTAVPHPKDDATFVEGGSYRWVRHPIYAGILFMAMGWTLMLNSLPGVLMALVLFLFFDLKTRREERFLAAKFPEYADYQRRVRKLIPYIY